MITCPWCNTTYPEFQPSCEKCGGPLPPPPGDDPGPPPPPPPHRKPASFKGPKDEYFTIGIVILVGMAVIMIPVAVILLDDPAGNAEAIAINSLAFVLTVIPGMWLTLTGHNSRQKTTLLFRWGQATSGEITQTYRDSTKRVGNHPAWTIVYTFDVDGQLQEGVVYTGDISAQQRQPGQPVHVIYLAEDPRFNTIYPPFR